MTCQFIGSHVCATLCKELSSTECDAETKFAEQLSSCIESLPTTTDEWMRLFISCVADMETVGICICDASVGGAPIIHANEGYRRITGYTLEDMVGRSCRFRTLAARAQN